MLPGIGTEGQLRLRNASVLLVGAGGLGAAVATYLCGAGVGRIGIADNDVVSLSNLQRQTLYTEAQIGLPKVFMAAERLKAMNSDVRVETFPEGIHAGNAESIISGFDFVMDCCDNFPTRYLIDDVCAKLGKTWVHGAISEFAGQVTVFGAAGARRYSELYPDREYLCGLPRSVRGVIGAVPGFIGCLQACEAIKLITGIGEALDGRMLTIDCLAMTTEEIYF